MKTLLKNVTLLSEYGFGTDWLHVLIEDRKIASISKTLPRELTDTTVVECNGNLLIPAFYNTHCHAAMTLFRGYGEDLPLQRWLRSAFFPQRTV